MNEQPGEDRSAPAGGMLRATFARLLGKAALAFMRLRGGGSALPGLLVERLDPDVLIRSRAAFNEVILVAGTNGKTTTTKMLRAILEADQRKVFTNAAGSNMPRGVISALIARCDWRGRLDADVALLEVDEGYAGALAEALQPDVVVVLNLLRDQLDRYGELDRTARLLAAAVRTADRAVLNADDPRVAALAADAAAVDWFGASAQVRALVPSDDALHGPAPEEGAVTEPPEEGGVTEPRRVEVQAVTPASVGQQLTLIIDGTEQDVTLRLAGTFNAYNAAAALTAARSVGVDPAVALAALSEVTPAFGRSEQLVINGTTVLILLVKNPSGFNHIIHTYLTGSTPATVLIAVNDLDADGRDVSWLWDVDIEALRGTPHRYATTGTRGYDMALRLRYADVDAQPELSTATALATALDTAQAGTTLYLVATYTAMLDLRRKLARSTDLSRIEV